ncbi:MAG: DUF2842 domain-containing protein [Methylocella sp.]
MRRGTREFTGTSGIIGFVPVYALVAMALAQTRPLQHAPGLVQALCYAPSHGLDIAPHAADQMDGKTRSRNVTSSVRFVIKPRPTRGSAATQRANQ